MVCTFLLCFLFSPYHFASLSLWLLLPFPPSSSVLVSCHSPHFLHRRQFGRRSILFHPVYTHPVPASSCIASHFIHFISSIAPHPCVRRDVCTHGRGSGPRTCPAMCPT
ncbi:hypothetical protein C8R44DRAFT_823363 [Mycena epipterygia]|nr:hypothetical protein C8R44DRAFT_823363 [Mycena epipterygia]